MQAFSPAFATGVDGNFSLFLFWLWLMERERERERERASTGTMGIMGHVCLKGLL